MAIGKHVKTLLSQIPCRYIRTASSFRCSVVFQLIIVTVTYIQFDMHLGPDCLPSDSLADPSRIIQGYYTAVFVEHIEVQAGMDC